MDPDLEYRARHALADMQLFDAVHRHDEAERQCRNSRSQKQKLFQMCMREHNQSYQEASQPRAVTPRAPGQCDAANAARDRRAACRNQHGVVESRTDATGIAMRNNLTAAALRGEERAGATARSLGADELPPSPVELAADLIARSGVWRSKEQYLATLFLLQPLQTLWEQAMQQGGAGQLLTPGVAGQYAQTQCVRSAFLHGPGGIA